MSRVRLLRLVAIAAVVAMVAISGAAAFGFTDDSQTLASGAVGSSYRAQLRARNGCPPYSFRVSGSAALPVGLALQADGLISGTPTVPGRSAFWLAVHDSCGGDSQRSFSIVIYPAPPVGEIGVPFTMTLAATDAPDTSNTWSVTSGTLPAGVVLDPSGVLRGTPNVAGSFSVELAVFNPHHLQAPLPTLQLSLKISPPPSIAAKRLPRARFRGPYRATLTSFGGTTPMRWAVVRGGGTLPPGIRLNSKLGVLIGTARTTGSYRFTVILRDRLRQTATRRMVLLVT